MINYFALAENESKARLRFNLVEKMLQPCGPPPEKKNKRTKNMSITIQLYFSTHK